MAKKRFRELEILHIACRRSGIESLDEILTELFHNCPKLKHMDLLGEGFANIHNHSLLDLFRKFTVCITVDAKRQKFFEGYIKKHDSQAYKKYKKMKLSSRWLGKFLFLTFGVDRNHHFFNPT